MVNTEIEHTQSLRISGKEYDLSSRTLVMGIVNVTPDSFFDGGRFSDPKLALRHALQLKEQGADILDIGGESTRPGSKSVSVDEEIERVVSLIEQLTKDGVGPVSIDTQKSEVAEAAIQAGAAMVNDIGGLQNDPGMVDVVRWHDVPVVVMHMAGTPQNMQIHPEYTDLIREIKTYLQKSIQIAEDKGIQKSQLILDPGIGFGKSVKDNFIILQRLNEFSDLGCSILTGVSNKSFIGKSLNRPVDERSWGTAAAVAASILNGAALVRVHAVQEMIDVVRIIDYIKHPDFL
ncbi:dihydropteroate synthase [candidate division KSB1 bacterium]|nr:dihydropteroate synthase [candidate division KSB1 bacterium]